MSDVTDFTIDNASGETVRKDIQACLRALQSSNSKNGSDITTGQRATGMWFLRSDTNDLKIVNSSNGFTEVGNIDQDNLGLLPRSGKNPDNSVAPMTGQLLLDDAGDKDAPALSFDTDANLGLFRKSADIMGFASDDDEQMLFDANGLTLQKQNSLRFSEATANGSNYVSFRAPASVSSNITWTLPAEDANVAGYALVSDASGTLSWAAAGAGAQGGGSDNIFWENDQTITQNYTISNGHNAGSFGPIEIQSGVTVTVGAGETWTVV
tara:strand:- start:532 stop:1332 length:801 start_codon:yes stop_codon:yes gene_type:complete